MLNAIGEAGIDRFAAEMEIRLTRVAHRPPADALAQVEQAQQSPEAQQMAQKNPEQAQQMMQQAQVPFLDSPLLNRIIFILPRVKKMLNRYKCEFVF